MHFQFNLPEGGKKNTFRDKEVTNKVTLMFLNVQLLRQKVQIAFFDSVNKQARYLAFKNS